MANTRMSLDEVEAVALEALLRVGTEETAARSLSRAVRAAEHDGMRSHGLLYLPIYCEHVRCGKVDGTAVPVVLANKGAAVVVDASTGFAHPAIDVGFERLVPAAHNLGCAALTIRNSYNCGALGYHVERLANAGLLGIGFTNAPASIAPWGGVKAVIGTNPFALGVPGGEQQAAFVIDQSASVVAKSEIMKRARDGGAIPEGWALDEAGQPTEDPTAALKGTMLPSGGYKGFGAGLLVEVMAAALAGASLGLEASPFSGTKGGPPKTGQCFIALDPGHYSGNTFAEKIGDLCAAISQQDGARLPGSRRITIRHRLEVDGVEVEDSLLQRIQQA